MKIIYNILILTLCLLAGEKLFTQGYTWQELGTGLQNGTNGYVYAITSFNGKIIFGGSFTQASGVPAVNIAAYDPTTNTWSPLGAGINGNVYALSVYNGVLIAGGFFTQAGITSVNNIARWNGTNWLALGSGINNEVYALSEFTGELIAAGNFSSAGGTGANNIAKWNGTTWNALGSGLTGSGDRVNALTVFQGNLVAGGRFENSGSATINDVAKWNGSAWSAFNNDDFGDNVNALTVYSNELYAGGDFTQIGSNERKYIAKWNGSGWINVGGGLNDGPVEEFSIFRNTLIIGGNFRVTGTGLFVDRIAGWNGSSWNRLMTGHNDHVYALFTFNSSDTVLYSGGEFTSAGGKWCYFSARWGKFNTSTVSGEVRYADNNEPVLFGKVKIVRYDVVTREVITVDSALISNGQYTLQRVPKQEGLLRVISVPDDELDAGTDTNYVPTYYPSTIQWVQAGMVNPVNNVTNVNINVIRRTNPVQGGSMTVNMGGYVYLNILPPVKGLLGGFPYLKSSILYLKKDNSYIGHKITDENEQYSFQGLLPGTYTLTVQRLGYETETRQITLGGVNQDTVNFYLDTLNVIGITNISTTIPENFLLKQNYPNPFNPQTKIRFALKQASFTELKVFDILGREVETLVSEYLKPGEYEADFTAVRLTSGVYFYRLTAEGYSETRKMVMVK